MGKTNCKKGLWNRTIAKWRNIYNFIRNDIWSVELDEYSKGKHRSLRVIRIVLLSLRGFTENAVQLRASALTFYTLMSLVPILAMGFGIAKGFGLEHKMDMLIHEKLTTAPALADKLVEFANALLQRTGAGLVAGIGVVMLFWSIIKVLNNIERSFNAIWQINSPRPWLRKFSDYISMIIIAPLLLITASGVNVYIRSVLQKAASDPEILLIVKTYVLWLLRFVPYILIPLLFALLYVVMPNTKVKFSSGLIAGIVAGAIFVGVQWGYLYFQFGVSRYNAIYGSFAAIPLFLVWMQLSWLIVLLGAELSYAVQNVSLYEFEHETKHLSARRTKELSLLLLNTIVERFRLCESPYSAGQLAREHGLPYRLTMLLLQWMVSCQIICEVIGEDGKDIRYQPAQSIDHLTFAYVVNCYDNYGATIRANGKALAHISQLYETHAVVQGNGEYTDQVGKFPQ